ncbi:hypothetical protein RB2654_15270 [Rhodobacterales bacterium HTCC2654]|uniref:Uncharacterized protein n=1 Tax=Maritimibacter alkaliphilus HTCC2654 TaxID=314271 RepID=A3VHA3_9RHOB|nr:hypothetical protein RB2654_15270 [Rhodobacterales bacterium HTCC2654] [Maritimibacter alkaliphilus HTCC2654]
MGRSSTFPPSARTRRATACMRSPRGVARRVYSNISPTR